MAKKKALLKSIIVILLTFGSYFFGKAGGIKFFSENPTYQITDVSVNYNDQRQQYIVDTSAVNIASGVTVKWNVATSDLAEVNPQLFRSIADYISKHKIEINGEHFK